MKRIVNSITFRLCLTVALFTALVIHPQLSVSHTLAAPQEGQIKSESQLRSEASRYESAVRAIGDIASMKLENPDELKKALAIIDREKPNLKLQRSKLMAMGLEDSTFRDSVKKATPNKEAAEALVKELSADPKAVLKLNGAQALATKLEQSARADLAIVQRTAERLKAVSEKFKKTGAVKPGTGFANPYAELIPVGYRTDKEAYGESNNYPTPPTQAEIVFTAFEVIVIVVLVAFAIIALVSLFSFLVAAYEASSGDKKAADCLNAAEKKLETCDADAGRLFPPFNFYASAKCWGQWLLDSAGCAWK